MAYIYLDELKKILPGILDQWIDEDDESWEWIFQEIEQKCYVGKRYKGKKWKKKIQSMVDTHSTVLSAHRNDINKLESLLKGNIDNVTQLGLTMKDLGAEIRRLRNDISAAKSMAETAKQRTEVDYSKYSGKSDGKKMCKTCKYSSNIDGSPKSFDMPPCDSCNHNNKWEAKDDE